MVYCRSCHKDVVAEVDSAAGNSVCTSCGTVLEENAIVSEIQFGETSGGAAMVQGSYIGADQTRARAPAGFRQKGGGQESKEQTMANGRRRLQAVASALRISDVLTEKAVRLFALAVNNGFTQGRRTQYVVAACLYIACRQEKNRTQHMLIDFSDLLEINVFVLGSTYLKLCKTLAVQDIQLIDPSVYISRFAALLEFGDETPKVAADATRLASRMARDWMVMGRRPAGVCGACLLLAARMNNFKRSIAEVVQVVKIADVTLRKRLAEFRDTPSGELTVSDFRSILLEEEMDPPAFAKSEKKEKKARESRKGKEKQEDNDEDAEERQALEELADQVEEEAASSRETSLAPSERGSSVIPHAASSKKKRKRTDDDEAAEPSSPTRPGIEDDPELDEAIAQEVGVTLESRTGQILMGELDKAEAKRLHFAVNMTNLNDSDRLDDLDEAELDTFILTEKESEDKSRLWMEMNRDYLQALADKQTGPDGELKPAAKRRIRKKNRPRDSTTAVGTDAADAAAQLFANKKRFSKKINYNMLDALFHKNGEGGDSADYDAPLLGSTVGGDSKEKKKKKKAQSGPLLVPMPTFSGSGSRAGSVAPAAAVEEDMVEAPPEEILEDVMAQFAPEEEEEPEQEEDNWRKQLGHQEEDVGYNDYDEEV